MLGINFPLTYHFQSENLEEKQKQQEEDRMRRVESEHLRYGHLILKELNKAMNVRVNKKSVET